MTAAIEFRCSSVRDGLHGSAIAIYRKDKEAFKLLATHIGKCLERWQSLLNVARPLTNDQIADISILIPDLFGDFTLRDILYFFRTLLAGNVVGREYPKLIDRVDWSYLNECLLIYRNAKNEARQRKVQEEQSALRALPPTQQEQELMQLMANKILRNIENTESYKSSQRTKKASSESLSDYAARTKSMRHGAYERFDTMTQEQVVKLLSSNEDPMILMFAKEYLDKAGVNYE